jgi:cardiolipin synthase
VPTDLPNLLTLSRIAAIPLLVVLVALRTPVGDMAACVVFSVAAITDYFDGKIARDRQITSGFGRMLDPIADKLLVGARSCCWPASTACPTGRCCRHRRAAARDHGLGPARIPGGAAHRPAGHAARQVEDRASRWGALGTLLAGDSGAPVVGLGFLP